MNHMRKRLISLTVALLLCLQLIPPTAFAAGDRLRVENDYLALEVNPQNGGFSVITNQGDVLRKEDDLKQLLFDFDQMDTSFLTLKVGDGTYIYGSDRYGTWVERPALDASGNGVVSKWTPKDTGLTVTQHLQVVSDPVLTTYGTVQMDYKVENGTSAPVTVGARLLLDTQLGGQDYGVYQFAPESTGYYDEYPEEARVTGSAITDHWRSLSSFTNPDVVAYGYANTADQSGYAGKPGSVVFSHWYKLASAPWDIEIDDRHPLRFTDNLNSLYKTADSAVALFWEAEELAAGDSRTYSHFYGIKTNRGMERSALGFEVTSSKTAVMADDEDKTMTVSAVLRNTMPKSKAYDQVTVRLQSSQWIKVSNEVLVNGNPETMTGNQIIISNLKVGDTIFVTYTVTITSPDVTRYLDYYLEVYDTSRVDALEPVFTEERLLASQVNSIFAQGVDKTPPQLFFTGSAPQLLFNDKNRSFIVTGEGFHLLEAEGAKGKWAMFATHESGVEFPVSRGSITFANRTDSGDPKTMLLRFSGYMPEGAYQLRIENYGIPGLTVGGGQPALMDETALPDIDSAWHLMMSMTSDPAALTQSVGVVAVEVTSKNKGGDKLPKPVYEIKGFTTRSEFDAYYLLHYEDIPLFITGDLTITSVEQSELDVTKVKACTVEGDGSVAPILINDVLEYTGSEFTMTQETDWKAGQPETNGYPKGNVKISMKGPIGARGMKTMWKDKSGYHFTNGDTLEWAIEGEAAVTDNPTPVLLELSGAAGGAINAAGYFFDLRYAEHYLRIKQKGGEEMTLDRLKQTVSFGGGIDLSFIGVEGRKNKEDSDDKKSGNQQNGSTVPVQPSPSPSASTAPANPSKSPEKKTKYTANTMTLFQGSVNDVRFDKDGLDGVSATMTIGLPQFAPALPLNAQGTLTIDTFDGGTSGISANLEVVNLFEVKGEITLSRTGKIVTPDTLMLRISAEPGIGLVTPPPVVFIKGGMLGITDLHSIVRAVRLGAHPSTQLHGGVKMDIVKALEGWVELSIGANYASIAGTGIEIVNVPAIDSLRLRMDYYPFFALSGDCAVNIADILQGGMKMSIGANYLGKDEFIFEMGGRVNTNIPIFGKNINIGVDANVTTKFIQGLFVFLDMDVGFRYYYGAKSATFMSAIPTLADVDEEGYMALSNVERIATTGSDPALMALTDHQVKVPSGNGKTIELTMSNVADTKDQGLMLCGYYDGDISIGELTLITPDRNYPLEKIAAIENDVGATGNVAFGEAEGKRAITILLPKKDMKDGTWKLTTTAGNATFYAADLMAVGEIAKLTGVETDKASYTAGENITITPTVSGEPSLNAQITYFLSKNPQGDEIDVPLMMTSGYYAEENNKAKTLALPDALPSGTYYVVATLDDAQGHTRAVSQQSITVTNDKAPAGTLTAGLAPIGDGFFKVTPAMSSTEKLTGYLVEFLDEAGVPVPGFGTSMRALDADGDGVVSPEEANATFAVGGTGKSVYADEEGNLKETVTGLPAGAAYQLRLTPYQKLDELAYIYGTPVLSAVTELPEPKPATLTITTGGNMTAPDSNRKVTIHSNQAVKALAVYINETPVYTGTLAENGTYVYSLADQKDGDYVVRVTAVNGQGDTTEGMGEYSVRTAPPTLLITAPAEGQRVKGSIALAGTADPYRSISCKLNGETVSYTPAVRSGDQVDLAGTIAIPESLSAEQTLTLEVEIIDAVGHSSKQRILLLGESRTPTGISLRLDGQSYPDGQVHLPSGAGKLEVVATNGTDTWTLPTDAVTWAVTAVGSTTATATVDGQGVLRVPGTTEHLVTATYAIDEGYSKTAYLRVSGNTSETVNDAPYRSESAILTVRTTPVEGVASATPGEQELARLLAAARGQKEAVIKVNTTDAAHTVSLTLPKAFFGTLAENTKAVLVLETPLGQMTFDRDTLGGLAQQAGERMTLTISRIQPEQLTEHQRQVVGDGYPFTLAASIDGSAITHFAGTVSVAIPLEGRTSGDTMAVHIAEDGRLEKLPGRGQKQQGKDCFVFATRHFSLFALINDDGLPFLDVTTSSWYYEPVRFVYDFELFNGVSATRFAPEDGMTRAMFTTVLWRMAGSPTAGSSSFVDVPLGQWYSQAVGWAQETGVTTGYAGNRFGTEDMITREQIATMVMRYLAQRGEQSLPLVSVPPLSDWDKASPWAKEGLLFATSAGLLQGSNGGELMPGKNCSRAEAAAIFQRLYKALEQAP